MRNPDRTSPQATSGARTERGLTWGGFAWLPLVTPVEATRFRTDDERLAATVVARGGGLDEARPDIEVLADRSATSLRASRAVVRLSARASDSGPWLARRSTRIARGLRLQARAAAVARALRRQGYVATARVLWEPDDALARRSPSPIGRRTLSQAFPVHVELVADRAGRRQRTVFEAAVDSAAVESRRSIEIAQVLVRDTSLLAFDESTVLRLELGRAETGVVRQLDALAELGRLAVPTSVRSRASSMLAHGQCGLGVWSLEQRFTGSAPANGVGNSALDDCIDFLIGLADAWSGPVSAERIEREADVVARSTTPVDAETVRWLARRVASRVETLRGVISHGDFFHRNLVVDGGRLNGVIDWERSTLGRPVLHDLVHMRVADRAAKDVTGYGRAVVGWVRESMVDRSMAIHRYCERLGLIVDKALLVEVATGCWLAHVAHQSSRIADNASDRRWVAENISAPARELAALASAESP